MTVPSNNKVPAVGQAWSGDWRGRIAERIRARGFSSVTAFAEAKHDVPLKALADDLSTDHVAGIDHADVAAEQIIRLWREEATSAGREAIECFARRLLVGELHRDMLGGWIADWTASEATRAALRQLLHATSAWAVNVGKEHEASADRVFEAMLEDGRIGRIPPGWLPADADDPILVDLFRRHWTSSSGE